MVNRVTHMFLACLFFASSTVLPMGDFFLMQDLPAMYQNYTRLAMAEDAGLVDFLGDYLLGGRELFNHNKNDKTDSGAGGVNFQHQANPLPIIILSTVNSLIVVKELIENPGAFKVPSVKPAFQSDHFRPPIV